MPILYKQHFTGFQHSFDELGDGQRILLFDPVLERSADSVGDRFRRLDAALRDVDITIVRGATQSIAASVRDDPVMQRAAARGPIAVLFGSMNASDLRPRLELIPGCGAASLPDLSTLRQAELHSIYGRTGAVFRSTQHHFVLPSGEHADRFIRLGDALRDRVEIRRIADWLMPFIDDRTVIIGDTGSIIPLLGAVCHRVYRRFGWDLPFDCLAQYPRHQDEIRERLDDISRGSRLKSTITFVVSVNSSGKTLRLVENATGGRARLVTICDTHGIDTPGKVLSSLHVSRWLPDAAGHCPECERSPAMAIDPQTYERLPAFDWQLVKLRHDSARADREFWEMADSADAVDLHVWKQYKQDGSAGARHFGIFLDTEKLARKPEFRAHCIMRLSRLPRPDVILIPEHDHAHAIELVLDDHTPRQIWHRVPVGPLQPALRDVVRRSRNIWIADDAIVTGATLRGLRTCLHDAIRDVQPLPELFAFVLVARTSTEEELKAVHRPYSGVDGGHLEFGAKVLLPPPGQDTCPWCSERRLLAEFLNDLSEPSRRAALARIDTLNVSLNPPFLLGARQRGAAELVTAGSFFGDLHQKAAFAACVSATQSLIGGFRTGRTGEIIDILDLAMIVSAYFEAVFPSAVMRTCPRAQLWCPKSEPALTDNLRNVDLSRLLPATVPELGMAAALGAVPPLAVIDLLERAMRSDDDPALAMVLELIRMNVEGARRPQ